MRPPRPPVRARARELKDARRVLRLTFAFLIALGVTTHLIASADEPDPPPEPAPKPSTSGVASWYGGWFAGRTTACGQVFDPGKLSVAHRGLPCGTKLRVSHEGRSVDVVVTDRGPFVPGRALDLSRAAFAKLAPLGEGLIEVRAIRLGRVP